MLRINGHWEEINTLDDVSKVIREHYNEELADKMDELLERMFDAFTNKIEELEEQVNSWTSGDWDYDDEWYDD